VRAEVAPTGRIAARKAKPSRAGSFLFQCCIQIAIGGRPNIWWGLPNSLQQRCAPSKALTNTLSPLPHFLVSALAQVARAPALWLAMVARSPRRQFLQLPVTFIKPAVADGVALFTNRGWLGIVQVAVPIMGAAWGIYRTVSVHQSSGQRHRRHHPPRLFVLLEQWFNRPAELFDSLQLGLKQVPGDVLRGARRVMLDCGRFIANMAQRSALAPQGNASAMPAGGYKILSGACKIPSF